MSSVHVSRPRTRCTAFSRKRKDGHSCPNARLCSCRNIPRPRSSWRPDPRQTIHQRSATREEAGPGTEQLERDSSTVIGNSQLEHASQVVLQAAATSQDLADGAPSAWNSTPEVPVWRTQREYNRRLINKATHALCATIDAEKDPELDFSSGVSSATSKLQFENKAPEVSFVVEAKTGMRSFCGDALSRSSRRTTRGQADVANPRRRVREDQEDGGPRKLERSSREEEAGPSRRHSRGRGQQRELTGCWKGWAGMISVKPLDWW